MNFLWWLSNYDGFLVGQAGSVVLTAITAVILACLIARRWRENRSWRTNASDLGVLAFTVVQIASTYCGLYRENSLIYGVGVATAANIYFIFRFGGGLNFQAISRTRSRRLYFSGVSLALVNIPATIERFMEWHKLKLNGIVSFRASFFLVGGPTKTDSLNLALALLPFSLIVLTSERSRVLRAVTVLSLIGSTVVIAGGMSRGVYLGVLSLNAGILAVAWIQRIELRGTTHSLLRATGLTILATICVYVVSVRHMGSMAGGTATSDTRSVEGRLHIWNETLSHIHNYELLGVGGGNGALYTLKHIEAAPYDPLLLEPLIGYLRFFSRTAQ